MSLGEALIHFVPICTLLGFLYMIVLITERKIMRDKIVHFLKWYWDKSVIFGLIALGISAFILFSGLWIGILAWQPVILQVLFYIAMSTLIVHMILGTAGLIVTAVTIFKGYKYRKAAHRG